MRFSGKLALLGLAALLSAILSVTGMYDRAEALAQARVEGGRMQNVVILHPAESPAPLSAPAPASAALSPALPAAEEAEGDAAHLSAVLETAGAAEARETTISGGLRLKNETGYSVDVEQILADGPSVRLPAEGPQVLILHTHGSEAYTPAGLDRYEANDSCRTEDPRYSVIRVGDELAALLEEAGLRVLHDREIYDYPSYTGSYSRAGAAVEQYLESCPGIRIVLDIHRDALGANGVVYKTMAEEDGSTASQVMLLVGTDESGLEHPAWRGNLAFALYLQNAANSAYPTLMRPVELVPQRYNQQLTPGSLIVEVGSSGNTLREALAAIRLFGRAIAPALAELEEYGQ